MQKRAGDGPLLPLVPALGPDRLRRPEEPVGGRGEDEHHRYERDGQGQDGDDGFHRGLSVRLVLHRIADYRAGHAVAAAAAPAEFGADDRDDLDPGLAQQGIGAGVAVVGEHRAG
jgi:hypothetical protein